MAPKCKTQRQIEKQKRSTAVTIWATYELQQYLNLSCLRLNQEQSECCQTDLFSSIDGDVSHCAWGRFATEKFSGQLAEDIRKGYAAECNERHKTV